METTDFPNSLPISQWTVVNFFHLRQKLLDWGNRRTLSTTRKSVDGPSMGSPSVVLRQNFRPSLQGPIFKLFLRHSCLDIQFQQPKDKFVIQGFHF